MRANEIAARGVRANGSAAFGARANDISTRGVRANEISAVLESCLEEARVRGIPVAGVAATHSEGLAYLYG